MCMYLHVSLCLNITPRINAELGSMYLHVGMVSVRVVVSGM